MGFLDGYFGAKTESFMPLVRSLGAGFTKVYLFRKQARDWRWVPAFSAGVQKTFCRSLHSDTPNSVMNLM